MFPKTDEEGEVLFDEKGDTLFHQVPGFAFTSQQGERVTQQDLENKIYVTNFFFASCPDVCKKMSSQLSRVQEAFADNPSVNIVSLTVNPENDSPEVLAEYASMYGADPKKWIFLTGNREEIYTLAQQGFYLPVQQVEGQQDFIHSEKFMLVDKNQHIRGQYDGTDPVEVDRLITEINVLLDEYSKSK
ncbi:SCO family protein [Pontibacter sp. SGAir0037]|uniref:SCO family protein n=1 Tax=Pontibacter sp. SGAir0037 TaxID=2571030 RepID=UPI001F0D3159|nr:SCO family protein [Pontibacter sp. SGAir0037]